MYMHVYPGRRGPPTHIVAELTPPIHPIPPIPPIPLWSHIPPTSLPPTSPSLPPPPPPPALVALGTLAEAALALAIKLTYIMPTPYPDLRANTTQTCLRGPYADLHHALACRKNAAHTSSHRLQARMLGSTTPTRCQGIACDCLLQHSFENSSNAERGGKFSPNAANTLPYTK